MPHFPPQQTPREGSLDWLDSHTDADGDDTMERPVNTSGHLWGYLQPCSGSGNHLPRLDFWRLQSFYDIGRHPSLNALVLPGPLISNRHCRIAWSGDNPATSVFIRDLSTNGTYINGERVADVRLLRPGDEISFGTPLKQSDPRQDYRYIFHVPPRSVEEDTILDRYEIHSELGRGTFGSVYKVLCKDTGEWLAGKIVRRPQLPGPHRIGDMDPRVESLAREVAIMSRFTHPNICRMREALYGGGQVSMIMELVDGGNLIDLIWDWGCLKEPLVRHITHQMATALAYIHANGVVHRDLKPENILLTRANPPVVKIADFGLANAYDDNVKVYTYCGSPGYVAPEVLGLYGQPREEPAYDELCDSWSLGVIIFNMLTGREAFLNADQEFLADHVKNRTVNWLLLEELATLSASGRHFLSKLLVPDPMQRLALRDAVFTSHWIFDHKPYWLFDAHGSPHPNPCCTTSFANLTRIPPADQPQRLSEATYAKQIQSRHTMLTLSREGEMSLPKVNQELLAMMGAAGPAPEFEALEVAEARDGAQRLPRLPQPDVRRWIDALDEEKENEMELEVVAELALSGENRGDTITRGRGRRERSSRTEPYVRPVSPSKQKRKSAAGPVPPVTPLRRSVRIGTKKSKV